MQIGQTLKFAFEAEISGKNKKDCIKKVCSICSGNAKQIVHHE